jgi:probable F420-dependent oxidoreductase
MQFWNLLAFVEDEQLLDAARACEDIGFDAVGVSDHLFIPEEIHSPYPGSKAEGAKPFFTIEQKWSFPDPFVALGMMAAVTSRVKLFQSIYIMAPRNPIEVAKATGTLATLAPGRLTVCPAVGWMKDEFDVYGVDFHKRGKRTDEMIDVLRKLWSGEIVEHEGEFFSFPRLRSMPCPGNLPIIACGPSEPVMRRAAQRCDGWMDAVTDFATLPERLATLHRLREEADRASRPFEIIIIPGAQMGGRLTVDDLRRAEDQGVTAMQFNPAFFHLGKRSTLDEKKRLWEDFAETIMRHFQ